MKRLVYSLILVICIGTAACNAEPENIDLGQYDITLSIQPGEHWQSTMKLFLFSIKKAPQLAVWIEDDNENFISTIFITGRSANNDWVSAPSEGRPESLPVWNNKKKTASSPDNIDAVSSASPLGSVAVGIGNNLLINGNDYNVYLEINHSYDYNNFWTERNSGVNGQPSLIYHAQFTYGVHGTLQLVLIGHGSVDGSSGNIFLGQDHITTALSIMKNATLRVR